MRDNVLLEYGLFAGHLGRHRCILLMPDHPSFRIPSDFLGVAGFELYTDQTLNAVVKKVPERLHAAFVADSFKPPSLQERCRRLLLLSGWLRGEIAKIRLDLSRQSLKDQFGEKIDAILCFLKEDFDKLGLFEDATELNDLMRKSLDNFPDIADVRGLEYIKRDIGYFFSRHGPWVDWQGRPQHYEYDYRPYEDLSKFFGDELDHSITRRFRESCWSIEGQWCAGAIDMLYFVCRKLGEFDSTISSLERWRHTWVPVVFDRLGAMEQAVHKQIFGHL
jgi:hypothetical protein